MKLGAVSFLPKDKMAELGEFLEYVVLEKGKPMWKSFLIGSAIILKNDLVPIGKKRINFSRSLKKLLLERVNRTSYSILTSAVLNGYDR